jgi:methyl-accepting chemotaxis protein
MKILDNMKVGLKILFGYILVLIAMLIVGGVAVYQVNTINNTVKNLVNNLAEEQRMADSIALSVTSARLNAIQYINGHASSDLQAFQDSYIQLQGLVQAASEKDIPPERAAILKEIKNEVSKYQSTFSTVVTQIQKRDKTSAEVLDVLSAKAVDKLETLRMQAFRRDSMVVVLYAGSAEEAFSMMLASANQYLQAGDAKYIENYEEYKKDYEAAIVELDTFIKEDTEKAIYIEAKSAVDIYDKNFISLQNDFDTQNALVADVLRVKGVKIKTLAGDMSESVRTDFQAAYSQTEKLALATRSLIVAILIIAFLLSSALSYLITQNITRPLNDLQKVAEGIAVGDLGRNVAAKTRSGLARRKDELGVISHAFKRMVMDYLRPMTNVAKLIADGDLTIEVTPHSEHDELGIAFKQMIENLRTVISGVKESSVNLSRASNELALVASQTGSATGQITMTIQQVAKGIGQQSISINKTAESVEVMKRAINGVANGAQEQANAVTKASEMTGQLSEMITQVTESAQQQVVNANRVADDTHNSAAALETTINGMDSIKEKVNLSAQKVKEMSENSRQISTIVELIDEISSQTNLLALNAAIEAARAGEHGKGFAVVADEVRKLAEKSNNATNEIESLIKQVQKSADDAVAAMKASAEEVEKGVTHSKSAGMSLAAILNSTLATKELSDYTAEAARKMSELSDELLKSMEVVSAVVEENTASTEEMSATSEEVSEAVENIASVSEENSAATEEVSASTEEMNAQIEEVAASVQSLADMAKDLQDAIEHFKLPNDTVDAADSPSPDQAAGL